MGKTKLLHNKTCKPGNRRSKSQISAKKCQLVGREPGNESPAARRVQQEYFSTGNNATSDNDLDDEELAENKVLQEKARKARNQCRYYQK
jgi:hypothetical protein